MPQYATSGKNGSARQQRDRRHRAFVSEYLASHDAIAAAIAAGYAARGARTRAFRLLADPRIVKLLRAGHEAQARVVEAYIARSLPEIVEELEKIAMFNWNEILAYPENGGPPSIDWTKFRTSRTAGAAVSSLEFHDNGQVKRVRLHNKPKALVDLGINLGGFRALLEPPDLGPKYTPEDLIANKTELVRRLALIVAKGLQHLNNGHKEETQ